MDTELELEGFSPNEMMRTLDDQSNAQVSEQSQVEENIQAAIREEALAEEAANEAAQNYSTASSLNQQSLARKEVIKAEERLDQAQKTLEVAQEASKKAIK